MSVTTTATSDAKTILTDVKFSVPLPLPVGTAGLFDVIVYGPEEFKLIPKCELAKTLAAMWLHMEASTMLTFRPGGDGDFNSYTMHLANQDVESLSLRFRERPHITKPDNNGSGLGHERAISIEEYEVALKAIEAHRAAKRPVAPSRKSKKRRGAAPQRTDE